MNRTSNVRFKVNQRTATNALAGLLFFFAFGLRAQKNQDLVNWIDEHAIVIEDASPDTPLGFFDSGASQKFTNAKVFGFGEASHHSKEFFDLKAKFFKYLVMHQNLRIFIMEESYQAEKAVNDWLQHGEGSAYAATEHFGQGIWQNQQVLSLLQWMRDFNAERPKSDRIWFYGMDNQFGHDINVRLRKFVSERGIVIEPELLSAADSCAAVQLQMPGIRKWADRYLPKLNRLEEALKKSPEFKGESAEAADILRGLHYLKQFTAFVQDPYSQYRDRDMYENVKIILAQAGPESKAFIWAHNEHINKKELYASSRLKSLGRWLKDDLKDDYYAMGFDFGGGKLPGASIEAGIVKGWTTFTLDAPFPHTAAEMLVQAKAEIYFLDLDVAALQETTGFFKKTNSQLMLGGPGFNPEKPVFYKRRYGDSYDGLIFIRQIGPPTRRTGS